MVKVLINLLMNEETQQQMDSFLLRNTSVDLAAITEQFLVKFMLHYETQLELDKISREGADLEVLHGPTTFDLGQTVASQGVIIEPEKHLIRHSSSWDVTPIAPEELRSLQKQGLASPLLPRAGAANQLMASGPVDAAGSPGQKGRKKASAPNAEDATSSDH